jgi:hypothetical protein
MKRRTNITINETIYEKAQQLMRAQDFDDFSGYLEQLIREEWARKHPHGSGKTWGQTLDDLQRNIDATSAGAVLNEGECLTPEQAADAVVHTAAASAAPGKPVSYAAKPAKPKKPQSPKSSA